MALPLLRLSSPIRRHHFSIPISSSNPLSPKPSNGLLNLRLKVSPLAVSSSASAAPEVEAAPASSQLPKTKLIAQNIPWTYTVDDVRAVFEKHGTVVDCELSMYSKNKNRGLAFITMSSEEEAISAINSLNSSELDGRAIKVAFSKSSKKTSPPQPTTPVTKYNVFVGNLSWKVRSGDLREFFSGSGNVLSAEVIFQNSPRRSAGYGFVSFASEQEAKAVIDALNGKELMGRPVRLLPGKFPEGTTQAESVVAEPAKESSTE